MAETYLAAHWQEYTQTYHGMASLDTNLAVRTIQTAPAATEPLVCFLKTITSIEMVYEIKGIMVIKPDGSNRQCQYMKQWEFYIDMPRSELSSEIRTNTVPIYRRGIRTPVPINETIHSQYQVHILNGFGWCSQPPARYTSSYRISYSRCGYVHSRSNSNARFKVNITLPTGRSKIDPVTFARWTTTSKAQEAMPQDQRRLIPYSASLEFENDPKTHKVDAPAKMAFCHDYHTYHHVKVNIRCEDLDQFPGTYIAYVKLELAPSHWICMSGCMNDDSKLGLFVDYAPGNIEIIHGN